MYNIVKQKSTILRIFTMSNHENLLSLVEAYKAENEKFTEKGNKAAGTRARKALAEIAKAVKERRKEIQDAKTATEVA